MNRKIKEKKRKDRLEKNTKKQRKWARKKLRRNSGIRYSLTERERTLLGIKDKEDFKLSADPTEEESDETPTSFITGEE